MPLSFQRTVLLLAVVTFVVTSGHVVPAAEAQYFRFGKNKVQYHNLDWHFLQSTHFDVYYHEPGGEALATFTARAAEEAYAEIEQLFGYRLTDRVAILVYQGHNEFAVTNAVDLPEFAEGIGGVTELYKNRIALPFTGDHRQFRRVLHHEIVHAVVNDMFYGGSLQRIIRTGAGLRLPLWFNEGIAEYSALGWDTHSDMYLREAVVNDRLPPVTALYGYLAYRGGQGFFDYVAAMYGREKITEILQRVKAGSSLDAAIERSLGMSLEAFSDRWRQALRAVYFPEVTAREDLEAIADPLVTRDNGGRFNTGAAISPQGNRVAFLSARGGLFDVFLINSDGSGLRRLIAGQTSPQFESFRILTPGISWNPAGTRLAIAVKAGPSDAIALVDVESRRTQHYRVPGLDAILSVRWSPDGSRIALSGTSAGQSDIYVLDLQTRELTNLTRDVFSDLEPTWSPDGRSLIFHSDRGDHLQPGLHDGRHFDVSTFDFGQFSLYRIDLDNPSRLQRLTADPDWDDTSAAFGNDPDRLLFISDRNGIPNLYELHLETAAVRPLTDLFVGVTQVSVSRDGRSAALVALRDGAPSIYFMRDPFERELQAAPAPTVFAHRVMGEPGAVTAPALSVAHPTTLRENPFLREAASPVPFAADLMRRRRIPPDVLHQSAQLTTSDTLALLNGDNLWPASSTSDSLLTEEPVDFRTYSFEEHYREAQGQEPAAGTAPRRRDPFAITGNVREDGSFATRRYRLRFSPDLIYGNLGYDALFGIQSFTQITVSDLMGDHRISAASNLIIDLRNSDYLLTYQYLAGRTNYALTGFHVARQLTDFDRQAFFRYRNYGAIVGLSHPIDKFRRIEAEISLQGVELTDLMDPALRSSTRGFVFPALTFISDHTVPGFLTPQGGRRFGVRVAATPGPAVAFASVLADARQYFGNRYYSVGLRAAGGASIGRDAQRYYSAGVQNWLNPSIDGLPIRDENDFVFGTPILPLRGHRFDAASGDRFLLTNVEARFPLVAALLPGPFPMLPLYHLQGIVFLDAAAIPGEDAFSVWREMEDGGRVLDDVYVGAGFGLRTLLLGYPVRLDWGWPFDGTGFGRAQFHLSIGLDF